MTYLLVAVLGGIVGSLVTWLVMEARTAPMMRDGETEADLWRRYYEVEQNAESEAPSE